MESGRVTRTVSPFCRVSRVDGGGQVRFVVEGEVDASVSTELFHALVELGALQPRERLRFELDGMTFCAVQGLRVFEDLADRVTADGGKLTVRGMRRVIRRTMVMLDMDNVLFEDEASSGNDGDGG